MPTKSRGIRVPIWQIAALKASQRRRTFRFVFVGLVSAVLVLILSFCGAAFGWDSVLDWAVVAIPVAAGLMAWFLPVRETTRRHKLILSVGCILLGGLVFVQQYRTRKAHSIEIKNLPTIPYFDDRFRDFATKDNLTRLSEALFKAIRSLGSKPSAVGVGRDITSRAAAQSQSAPQTPPQEPSTPEVSGILNSASQGPLLAPGAIGSIQGRNLGLKTASVQSTPWPTSLAGVSLKFSGTPAQLNFVSPGQINFRVPPSAQSGIADVVVTVERHSSKTAHVNVVEFAPGIFTGPGNRAIAVLGNGTIIGDYAGLPRTPINVGDFVTIYGTGLGAEGEASPTKPSAVGGKPQPTLTVGGKSAQVLYAGSAPPLLGVFQLTLKVPDLVTGTYPVVITMEGRKSNSPLLSVGPW